MTKQDTFITFHRTFISTMSVLDVQRDPDGRVTFTIEGESGLVSATLDADEWKQLVSDLSVISYMQKPKVETVAGLPADLASTFDGQPAQEAPFVTLVPEE